MRPIEFRGKNTLTGEWVYGAYIFFKSQNEHVITHFKADSEAKDGYLFIKGFYPVAETIDIETLGQFTGLYDDDGDEIYEGDILRLEMCKDTEDYIVEWDPSSVRFVLKEFYDRCFAGYGFSDKENMKIIGNIYENPELLNGVHQ